MQVRDRASSRLVWRRGSWVRQCLVCVAVLVSCASRAPAAQSLADVARKEADRRKTITSPSKVYTNEDLPATVPRRTPPPEQEAEDAAADVSGLGDDAQEASRDAAGTEGTEAPGVGASEPQGPRDEAYWQRRLTRLRDEVDRDRVLMEALQSRINALTTDFVNRDDPFQRQRIAAERERALSELEHLEEEISRLSQAQEDLREEARRAEVPPGWLR